MASSERLFGCALAALLGGCTLITNADDHRDGTGTDAGPSDAFVADAGDLGVEDMLAPQDMSVPEDMITPDDMFRDGGIEVCGGVADLSGGSLVASGLDAYDVTDFTIETWFQPDAAALSGNRNLFGRWGVNGSTGSYALFISNGQPALAVSCTGTDTDIFTGSETLIAGAWVHLAATFNASTNRVRLFVDGTSVGGENLACGVGQTPPFPLGTAADLVLGYDDPSGGNPAQGLVDEARLSSIVRYPDEFTPERTFMNDAETVALYHFEDGTLPASDESTNDNPMTGAGAASLETACRP